MSLPVRFALRIRVLARLLLVSYILYQFPIGLGLTYPWILSPDFLPQTVTLSYLLWLTVSPRRLTSFHYPNYHLLNKLLNLCYFMFSVFMASPETLSLTGGPNLPLVFGVSFAGSWGPPSASHQASTPSPMARQRG